jgi:imidazolonepropionase-like amidohydrolase
MDDKRFAALQQDSLTAYLAKKERAAFLSEQNDYRKLRLKVFDGKPAPQMFAEQFAWMQRFTKTLAEHHVPLLAGSDTYGMAIVGFSLHREMQLLQQSGLSPYQILLAATVTPARYLGNEGMEGTIAEGKNANLVLLRNNPLEDIRHTQSIEAVMKKGRLFGRDELDGMLKEVRDAFR